MKITSENKRNIALGIAVLIILSPILVSSSFAQTATVNLPPDLVYIMVVNGTTSFFNTTLSGVPSGYDVTNATYVGWCIDRTAEMARDVTFQVILYSDLNPPGNLSSVSWNMVNYILNHKQGTSDDIQQAIWYFANMADGYVPTSPLAQIMVADALANGTDFIPAVGQIVGVICFPIVLFPSEFPVQVNMIELQVPEIPELHLLAIPLLIALTAISALIIRKRNFHNAKPTPL